MVKLAVVALLLLGCETVAVEPTLTPVDPRQPLPTAPIVIQVAATPAPDEAEPEVVEEDAEPVETPTPPDENGAELMALGEEVYEAQCATCHQSGGEGTANFPALAGSPMVTDEDPTAVLAVIIHGRGQMPAFGDALSNEEIAAVASYIRNAWGNEAALVSEEQVGEAAESN
jgi:cytochrome c oxidase subunit 2